MINRRLVLGSVLVFLGCASQRTPTVTALGTVNPAVPLAVIQGPSGSISPESQTLTVAVATVSPPGDSTPTPAAEGWFRAAMVQSKLLVGANGQTWVGLWIDAPTVAHTAQRAPMDVALVIDTSGSMSGEKIANARVAAASVIASLADGDIVSMWAFSVGVSQVAPPTVVSSATRPLLQSMANTLVAGGGTNMWAGLEAGENTVAQAPPSHPVRRVVVISDGQANIGPHSPEELGNLVARGTEFGTQVTAIGVGLDYDERTLGALAVRSSGRLYHLEAPQQMATILQSETELLGQTVARDVYIELDPPAGIVLEATDNLRLDRVNGRLRIPLGAVHSGQHREILLRARVPTTAVGVHPVGSATLVYSDPGASASGATEHRSQVALSYEVTPDASVVARGANSTVLAMVTSYEASQSQMRAADMLNRGEAEAAVAELDRAQAQIQNAQQQYHFDDAMVSGQLVRQSAGLTRGREAARRVMSAPAAARPSMSRGASLQNSSDAMHSAGY